MKWFSCAVLVTAVLVGMTCFQGSAEAFKNDLPAEPAGTSVDGPRSDSVSSTLDDDEKLTIKKIMKLAHKSGLLKKVATGKATDAEIAKLNHYYKAMPELTPPKGDAESWKTKTEALVKASQAAVDKDSNAGELLKSATNCASCHDVHKK